MEQTVLSLPGKLLLNSGGIQTFAESTALQKMKKLHSYHGNAEEGFWAQSFSIPVLKKLLMNSHVKEFFVQSPDLLRFRKQVIYLNNLLIYTILYKKITPALSKALFESTILKNYNLKHPHKKIESFKSLDKKQTLEFCNKNQSLYKLIQQEVENLVLKIIEEDVELAQDEKEIRKSNLPSFMYRIDPRIWHLYLMVYKSKPDKEMNFSFAIMIYEFLENMQIATHLSNLLMEFIQNAEKAHFEKIFIRNNLSQGKVDQFLRSEKNRQILRRIAIEEKQFLDLAWVLDLQEDFDRHNSVSIYISNYGIINEKTKDFIAQKMKTDVKDISISSFFQEKTDNSLGAGLGLLYNSYLEDFCRLRGIQYSCTVFPEPEKQKTTVKIQIVF